MTKKKTIEESAVKTAKKEGSAGKVPKKIFFGWPSVTISTSVAAALVGYATFYATDVMGLSALTVGMIFMLSKVFDGFTDIIAGYFIDKTNSKLGKGRPWQFAIIGYWVSLVLLFGAPEMGVSASCVWLFVTYSLVNSVFMTLINCSDSVYLSNALETSEQSVSVLSFTGFISLIFTMVASMILPQLVKNAGTSRAEWFKLSLMLAVPFTLIGLIRVLVIREKKNGNSEVVKLSLKDMIHLLVNNKYILIFALIILLSNIGSNSYMAAQTYYYTWILGDIGLGSIMSLSMLAIIVVILLMPVLSRRFGFLNVIRTTTLIGMAGYLLRLLAYKNVGFLFVTNMISMMGFYTMFAFASSFVIDCIDYGEWKNGTRSEGTIACAQSVCAKIGAAFGAGIIGVLMGLSGYDGNAAAQTASANTMIILLYSVVPAALCLVQYILLRIYDLDKLLPTIRQDLAKKHEEEK